MGVTWNRELVSFSCGHLVAHGTRVFLSGKVGSFRERERERSCVGMESLCIARTCVKPVLVKTSLLCLGPCCLCVPTGV